MKEAKLRHKEQRAARWVQTGFQNQAAEIGRELGQPQFTPATLAFSQSRLLSRRPPTTDLRICVSSTGNAFPSLSRELLFVLPTSVYELPDFSDQLKTLHFKLS